MRRLGSILAAALVLAVVGCSSEDSGESTVDAAPAATTTTTTTATTTSAKPLPTSETVKIAVFERAYSECASTELTLLAAKYNAKRTKPAVERAVARAWTKYFKAGADAISDGRAGCRQAFNEDS